MLSVTGGRAGADGARPSPQRLLRGSGERAEAHPRDRDRDLELERLPCEPRPEDDVRVAPLPVALERVPGDARAQEEQVVEVREAPLRAEAADVVDPFAGGALDLGDDATVVQCGLAEVPGAGGHQYSPAWSTSKL